MTIKKFLLYGLCCLISVTSFAQKSKHDQHKTREAIVTVSAQDKEQFVLYVDGSPISSRANNKFSIYDIAPNQVHSFAVVLTRPNNMLAYTEIYISNNTHEEYFVRYNNQSKIVEFVDRNGNATIFWEKDDWKNHQQNRQLPPKPKYFSNEDADNLVTRLNKEAFDDNKLDIAKAAITNSSLPLTTEQIKRMAQTFTFDTDKFKFVEFAYKHCFDPQNYYQLTDIFTFNSDKENLLKVIQIQ